MTFVSTNGMRQKKESRLSRANTRQSPGVFLCFLDIGLLDRSLPDLGVVEDGFVGGWMRINPASKATNSLFRSLTAPTSFRRVSAPGVKFVQRRTL